MGTKCRRVMQTYTYINDNWAASTRSTRGGVLQVVTLQNMKDRDIPTTEGESKEKGCFQH